MFYKLFLKYFENIADQNMIAINFQRRLFAKEVFPLCCFFLLFFFISIAQPEANENNAAGRSLDSVTLQLKWVHQFNFAGYYAAVEKGYYQEAGLDVTIKEGLPGMDFIDEVISGRAQYGVEMPELLVARNKGKPVVVLAI